MTSTRRDPGAEQIIDETIRGALSSSGLIDHAGEYVTRYVVMAETVRVADDGAEHFRQYKVVPPGQTRGCTHELLQAGLDWTSENGTPLNPGA